MSPKLPKQRDDDTQPGWSTRLSARLLARWWIGGSIIGACAIVLALTVLAKKSQFAQRGGTQPFGNPSISPPSVTIPTARELSKSKYTEVDIHDDKGAIEDYNQALALDPKNATFHLI